MMMKEETNSAIEAAALRTKSIVMKEGKYNLNDDQVEITQLAQDKMNVNETYFDQVMNKSLLQRMIQAAGALAFTATPAMAYDT